MSPEDRDTMERAFDAWLFAQPYCPSPHTRAMQRARKAFEYVWSLKLDLERALTSAAADDLDFLLGCLSPQIREDLPASQRRRLEHVRRKVADMRRYLAGDIVY